MAHININSLRNKFDMLTNSVSEYVDIRVISETKLDDAFPHAIYHLKDFPNPYRLDINSHGGGILVYVRDDIPSNLVNLDQKLENFEGLFIELELSKKNKWLLSYSYNPHKGNTKQHLSNISKGLDELNSKYDSILIIGDLNTEMSEPSLNKFFQTYNLESIVNKPTCFKNAKNPSCIDLMLTNKQERFLKAKTVETGLSDFHKMVLSVFKTSFKKQKPKIVTYRQYKYFDNEKFRESLITCFSTGKNISYDTFENLVLQTLGKMAPIKQKHIRGNQSPFMNKDIHNAIMTRTRLRNRFRKEPTEMNRLAYKKQRSYCVSLMRQSKKQYYGSLNVNHLTDNKNFWRVVKPNFSNKILVTNRVVLRDGGKIISDTEKVADTFNKFFVNIGKALKIDKEKQSLVETKYVFDLVLKAIKKYECYPSTARIKDKMNNNVFSFRKVTYEEILIEINSLDTSNSPQSEDILFKIIEDNAAIFAYFILQNFNKCIMDGKFPD